MPKKKWGSGRGALWIVALVLISSAGLRLGSGTGSAIAKGVAAMQGDESVSDDLVCEAQGDPSAILLALRSREAALEQREADLQQRSAALDLARQEIMTNMAALEQAEEDLKSTLVIAETAAENDLAKLTSVYENMKPKEAAPLFEAMSPDFAAGFLGRMRPDAAAAVMAGLQPETAYTISVILAGRNARAPTE
ncbi:MotE family protein [Aliiroseovarius sp. PTFE2010]|uniref:MotE family protein n=1 Tax=Aliiroseovarius sp. PTFE2010 TaxID=3417190 RepID=UPI003CFB356D